MNKRLTKIILVITVVMAASLSGCSVHEPANAHVQDAIDRALNQGIQGNNLRSNRTYQKNHRVSKKTLDNMLLPKVGVALPNLKNAVDYKFDIRAVDLPANAFFTSLVKNTSENIVVDPDVTGNISLVLKNVTILEGIQAACNAYGFQYEETPYGYHIETKKLITKIFTINYLDVARSGVSRMRVTPSSLVGNLGASTSSAGSSGATSSGAASSGSLSDSSEVKTTIDNNFWDELKKTLTSLIGDKNGSLVVVNPISGLVIVRAYPSDLRSVSTYLNSMQNIMARQVILEAKVLEVNLKAGYQAGIQWRLLGLNLNGTKKITGQLSDLSSVFTMDVNDKTSFKNVINLLNTQGRTEVLSSPRIATMNNQKAIIKVGDDEFFVTNVSNTTSGSLSNNVTQDVEFTPFFSGIALDVTPEITQNNSVTLHIHPVVSEVVSDNKSFVLGGQTTTDLPLAKSSIRESDSIVHAKNGEVIIIGGLMENKTKSFDGSIPGLDETPFRASVGRHDRSAHKIELVILLKPIIVGINKSDVWTNQLSTAKRNFNEMRKAFTYTVHSGSQPEAQTVPAEPSFTRTVAHNH